MKRDTIELGGEGSLRSLKMNLLVLVAQLVMSSEDICSRPTSVRSNSPDKFVDLNNGIRVR
jgi:hypothetical protein